MSRKKPILALLFLALPVAARADFLNQCRTVFDATDLAGQGPLSTDEHPHYLNGVINQIHLDKEEAPWTGNHFLFEEGGIASRWQEKNPVITRLLSGADDGSTLSANQVLNKIRNLSQDDLDRLSPAEKLDIYLGNYDFRITRTELQTRGPWRPMTPQHWEGFCNGLSAAAINQPEPVSVVSRKNPDGIQVHFQPQDIKGLLEASYFYVEDYYQIGSPSSSDPRDDNPADKLDAGAFDVALTTHLGRLHQPFVVDIDPGGEIWNYVAVGYDRKVADPEPVSRLTNGMPKSTVQVAHVKLHMSYADDLKHDAANHPTKAGVASGKLTYERDYAYDLYLNKKSGIVGGNFTSKDHPDFLWFPGGDGTDQTMGKNPDLPFDVVAKLAKDASSR